VRRARIACVAAARGEDMKYLGIALALVAAAAIATFARYESFDPCDWLERDMALALGVPPLMAQARICAAFMFRGIVEPDTGDCLQDWWHLKAKGPPEKEAGS
jgi:hypothetical protein